MILTAGKPPAASVWSGIFINSTPVESAEETSRGRHKRIPAGCGRSFDSHGAIRVIRFIRVIRDQVFVLDGRDLDQAETTMSEIREAVIVSAVRSAVGKGKKDGGLSSVHPTELSAWVMRAAVQQAGVDPTTIDDIFWGCAMPEASQGLNVARLASLRAGFPVEVPSATINRFCSSGLQTIALGAQQIMSGMAEVVMAGGIEMMSQVPMSGYHTRLDPAATESYIGMGFTAERVANRWKVSREDQDR